MDLDPEGLFRDDSDSEDERYQEREPTKELAVYLIDASPKMFAPVIKDVDQKTENYFHVAVSCISQSLKTQIIGRSNDEVAICFFNTKVKINLQNSSGVYVFNVDEREQLDRPTAKLIKEFSCIEETFMNQIGCHYGIVSETRENSLYNALWVAQALLRTGSTKTASKRILIFTNEDDPFGHLNGATKADMIRTTLQRAKDAQDLDISIELLPLTRPDEKFDITIFYVGLLGLEDDEISQFASYTGERLEDMTNQLRKRMFKKRKIRTVTFSIASDVSIEVNLYALIRPTLPGSITWLDSVTNLPLKSEQSFICNDTGALVEGPSKRFSAYKSNNVIFSVKELSEIKRVANGNLRLLGFKPLSCLKDYHNLKPSTFLFPSDEEVVGSTRIFVALHQSMLRLRRFAVAFLGGSAYPRIVALIAQDEILSTSGQIEPPGMHMIYLPYSDDIRHAEESQIDVDAVIPRATHDQIKKASVLLRRTELKDFSVCQFSNPGLQRHYGILQSLALNEDDLPDVKDETLPDEEGMARPGVANAIEEFKIAVYGADHDQEESDRVLSKVSGSQISKKRKAIAEIAAQESSAYDWAELAETGKLKDLTVMQLKNYLTAHSLPVAGKKDALISRILTHLGM